jgi:hypothetical protein
MAGHGEKLSRKREEVVAALLGNPTLPLAAAEVGVSVRRLRDWLRDPDFKAAYAEARRRVLEHAIARLQATTARAVTRLTRALTAPKDSDAIRAALGILDQARGGAELLDVLERLEQLEAAAKRREGKKR